jgi:hypothetical protein
LAGQIATVYYFAHFLIIIPVFGIIDNILAIIATTNNNTSEVMKKTFKN